MTQLYIKTYYRDIVSEAPEGENGYSTAKWIEREGPNKMITQEDIDEVASAAEILDQAKAEMQDRAATYDKPEGERSMAATVAAFEAITGVTMTEAQGWLFMSTLKAVRSQQGAFRMDSFVDGAAYFALAGEAANRDE